MALFCDVSGDRSGEIPMVLIHGFGGSAAAWGTVKPHLPPDMLVMAYDLPGHRNSVNAEGQGGAGKMAKALMADLQNRGIERFHLAGYSMGGAVAALMAMREGERVRTLSLFAPGGMGPEIDAEGLEAFARAKTADEIRTELQKMVADGFEVADSIVDSTVLERAIPGLEDALLQLYSSMFVTPGEKQQGVLPSEALAALKMPAFVYWGEADPTLPFQQMAQMPGNFVKTGIPDAGHMLLDECPELVAEALKKAVVHI